MNDAAILARDLIGQFDERLADMFIARPDSRITLAKAFARALEVLDGHNADYGETIVALAEMDREQEPRMSVWETREAIKAS